VAGTMSDRGVLFVGPSESLWQIHSGLQPWDLGDCFCYRKPGAPDAAARPHSRSHRVRETVSRQPHQPTRRRTKIAIEHETAESIARRLHRLLETDRADDAVRLAADASRHSPDDAVLRALEGRVRELSGDDRRAVAAYRAALYLEPRVFAVRFLLAACLDRLGRRNRARTELRAVMAELATPSGRTVPELQILGIPTVEEIDSLSRSMLESE
jgi:Flp pilus assembly protein TadD